MSRACFGWSLLPRKEMELAQNNPCWSRGYQFSYSSVVLLRLCMYNKTVTDQTDAV